MTPSTIPTTTINNTPRSLPRVPASRTRGSSILMRASLRWANREAQRGPSRWRCCPPDREPLGCVHANTHRAEELPDMRALILMLAISSLGVTTSWAQTPAGDPAAVDSGAMVPAGDSLGAAGEIQVPAGDSLGAIAEIPVQPRDYIAEVRANFTPENRAYS